MTGEKAARREIAPAKLNLSLHVTGQRDDGYHLLDSIVAFCAVGDVVTVALADDPALTVSGPFAADVPTGPDNLVLEAADLFGVPASVHLEKNLPPAAGIGGGSSDAAAVLRALSYLTGETMPEVLALGADVPVCLAPVPQRMRGVGEVLTQLPPLPPLYALLVNPRVAVSTPEIFKRLKRKDNPPMSRLPDVPDAASWLDWLAAQRNDLYAPAVSLCPVIGEVIRALDATGARLARMSGSGATCFALFETEAEMIEARDGIRAARGDWWVEGGALLGAEALGGV